MMERAAPAGSRGPCPTPSLPRPRSVWSEGFVLALGVLAGSVAEVVVVRRARR